MMMTQGNPYTEFGATWIDNVDGTGTVMTASSGSVDINTPGVYTLEYTHADIATNTGNTVTRTVTVTSGVDTTPPVVILE